ncbi:hypothetical protein [Streptomyces sp. TLI_105]|uniref:hypothetical protein n=1 Tax=Streptomyces sp. TLI_105 TaxID=1881019 RepID=UPI000897B29E|nr:hypothetical protein [Streptomyces sp. TLI_105]SED50170.1 hypothetical protein SAMN05428939_5375 [Streptomyces sp. TLI_105]
MESAYGIRNPTAPDADMPKGTVDKIVYLRQHHHFGPMKIKMRLKQKTQTPL